VMVLVIVRHVPWRIKNLRPYLCNNADDQAELRSRIHGKTERSEEQLRSKPLGGKTIIRFINQTQEDMQVYWISFRGGRKAYERLSLNDDRVRPTYEQHLFAVFAMPDDRCIACFVAEKFPSKAIIDSDLVDEARKKGPLPTMRRLWEVEPG
jgi:hypothetical protein